MLLIWKGRGWLVPVLALLALTVSLPCAENFVMMTNYQNETLIQIGISLVYIGVFVRTFFLLFPAKPPRHFVDAETGEAVFLKQVDSLYYLDVKYWAYGLLGIGLALFLASFISALL